MLRYFRSLPMRPKGMLSKKEARAKDSVIKLVNEFFGSDKKAELWMTSANPLLGGVSPEDMIRMGRSERLLKFVRYNLDENRRPNESR